MQICTRFVASVLISVSVAPAPAQACSVIVTQERTAGAKLSEARRLIRRATAIIDGEVVRPLTNSGSALVRAVRVLKGPRQELFAVGERDSCDIALLTVGERRRLILVGGPDVFYLPISYSNARYEDRVLGSDRRRVWPYRAGGAAEQRQE